MVKVGVIGAGAMGTAVSQTIAPNANVLLYARRKEVSNDINNTRVNSQYFPNVRLHDNITSIYDLNMLKEPCRNHLLKYLYGHVNVI